MDKDGINGNTNNTLIMQKLRDHVNDVNRTILRLIPDEEESSKKMLMKIIESALFLDANRYRSFFFRLLCDMHKVKRKRVSIFCALIEMLHAYSVMQECIFNYNRSSDVNEVDSYRYESALISGSVLLSLIFEILSNDIIDLPRDIKCQLVEIFSKHSGKDGLLGGYAMGSIFKLQNPSKEEITRFNKLKVSSIFTICAECVSIITNKSQQKRSNLLSFANSFGSLFAMHDQLHDIHMNELFQDDGSFVAQVEMLSKQISSMLEIFDDKNEYNKADLLRFIDFEVKTILSLYNKDRIDVGKSLVIAESRL